MPHVHEAIAQAWLDAFNAGDVPKLVSLYAEDCTHTSPKIRALHPELPILVVTARDRGGVLASVAGLAGEDCFEKPVRAEDLLAAVERRLLR